MCEIISISESAKILKINRAKLIFLKKSGHFKDCIIDQGKLKSIVREKFLQNIDKLRYYSDRKCVNCNGLIEITKQQSADTCSKKCRGKFNWEKQNCGNQKCKFCNKVFLTKRKDSEFCSHECQCSFRRTINRNKTCANCNTKFESRHKNAKFCSIKCKNKSNATDCIYHISCRYCFGEFYGPSRQVYCCLECKELFNKEGNNEHLYAQPD